MRFWKLGLPALILSFMAVDASAALNGYMTVVGAQQGDIEGDVTLAGLEGTFEINELHHLTSARLEGTTHQPLIVTTRLSKGVPLLLQALDTGETLDITIRLYRPNHAGAEINHYTLVLENARLIAGEPIFPDNLRPELAALPVRIRLRFEFDSIIHQYPPDDQSVEL